MESNERLLSPFSIWACLLKHFQFENERKKKEEEIARQMKAKVNEDKSTKEKNARKDEREKKTKFVKTKSDINQRNFFFIFVIKGI